MIRNISCINFTTDLCCPVFSVYKCPIKKKTAKKQKIINNQHLIFIEKILHCSQSLKSIFAEKYVAQKKNILSAKIIK